GTGRGAQRGILLKGGDALERAQKLDVVILDKTGTLTEGRPEVARVVPLGVGEDDLLRAAASLEARSEHPLAAAIVARARSRGLAWPEPSSFAATPGGGVSGVVEGEKLSVGKPEHLGVDHEEIARMRASGQTVVAV